MGIGNRFSTATLMLRNAISDQSDSNPDRAASTDTRPIVIGPPSCDTLTLPVTNPPTTRITAVPIPQVACQPATADSPSDMGSRATVRVEPAPIRPTISTVPNSVVSG